MSAVENFTNHNMHQYLILWLVLNSKNKKKMTKWWRFNSWLVQHLICWVRGAKNQQISGSPKPVSHTPHHLWFQIGTKITSLKAVYASTMYYLNVWNDKLKISICYGDTYIVKKNYFTAHASSSIFYS